MLFDLRGKGRRRTVRVIYGTLAILMGGGLVLFGVGSDVGGIFSNAGQNATGDSVEEIARKRLEKADAAVKARPRDPAAWAALARARFQNISTDELTQTGEYVGEGVTKAKSAGAAWDKYLSLKPEKVDLNLAALMRQVFLGLGDAEKAVGAQELVIEQTKPASFEDYRQLAFLAYAANQTRKAELSSKKALELAPKDQRNTLKSQFEQARTQAAQQAVQEAQSTPAPAPTSTPSPAPTPTTTTP
jgi:tetratricopeptide (TPR) repeat protein